MANGRGAMAKRAASAGGISCDLSREKSDGVLPWGSGGSKAWEHQRGQSENTSRFSGGVHAWAYGGLNGPSPRQATGDRMCLSPVACRLSSTCVGSRPHTTDKVGRPWRPVGSDAVLDLG